MDEGAAFFLFKNKNNTLEKSKVFSSVFLISSLISIFGSLIFLLFYKTLFSKFGIEITKNLAYIVIAYTITSPIFFIYQKILRINEEGVEFAKIMASYIAFQVVIAMILITKLNLGGIGLFISHALTSIIFYIFSLTKLIKQYQLIFDFNNIIKLSKYALPILPHKISGWGLTGLTILSISYFLGSESVGIFSALSFLSIIINIFSKSFFNAYQPWVYQMMQGNNQQQSKILKMNKILGISMIILATFLTFFSTEIISIFINSRYHTDFIILPVLIFSSLSLFLGSLFTYILYYEHSGRGYISISTFVGLFTNLLLTVTLTLKYGLIGAVLSLGISNFTTGLLKYYFSKKIVNYDKEQFIDLYLIAIILLIVGIMLIVLEVLFSIKIFLFIAWILALIFFYNEEFKGLKNYLLNDKK